MSDKRPYKILCASCRKRLFVYKGDFSGPILQSQFIPFEGVPPPTPGEPLMCPGCTKPWYMVNTRTGGMIVLTDRGIRPHEPLAPEPRSEGYPLAAPDTPPEFRGRAPDFVDKTIKETPHGK
jgi:hypothetical protein